ncbi:hypothetical protein CEXT_111471 [Caerostris extrusa]|uniref:Uncharacterized protein n=1 Tax=Caerostris extrusa TaxID=172846 RepID=A0AAV4W238_CAEEX|nr:hypothetical protein CEXT_111471 [Caerostris extrusa]
MRGHQAFKQSSSLSWQTGRSVKPFYLLPHTYEGQTKVQEILFAMHQVLGPMFANNSLRFDRLRAKISFNFRFVSNLRRQLKCFIVVISQHTWPRQKISWVGFKKMSSLRFLISQC